MMGFGSKFQVLLQMCLMMKLIDYVSSMIVILISQ